MAGVRSLLPASRLRAEALLPVGLALCVVGLFLPWLHTAGFWPRSRWPGDVIGMVLDGDEWRRGVPSGLRWWWALPLVYGLALPALWCSARGHGPRRWLLAVTWQLAIVEVMVLTAWLGPRAGLDERVVTLLPGYWVTLVGVVLVGVPPVVEHGRVCRWRERWGARPGARQARRAIDPEGLRRLPHPLRRLVREARALRADLCLMRPVDGQQSIMLLDIVGQLRGLDAHSRAELRDHGHHAQALLDALAPPRPRREDRCDELLRIDDALTRIEAMGLAAAAPGPYR